MKGIQLPENFSDKFSEVAGAFFILFIIIAVIMLAVIIMIYVFTGLACSKLSKKVGYDKGWLGWIPFANTYLLGKLGFELYADKKYNFMPWVMLALAIATSFFDSSSTLGLIASIAQVVTGVWAAHNIYKKLSTSSTVMTVFSAITLSGLVPFSLFAIRNNDFVEQIKNDASANNQENKLS